MKMFMRFTSSKNEFEENENMIEDMNEDMDIMEEREEEGFKKVSNYENVISKLSSSLSIADVLEVY
jgi:hypothetical protein